MASMPFNFSYVSCYISVDVSMSDDMNFFF